MIPSDNSPLESLRPASPKSANPSFWEDIVVSGFGLATSAAVAYGSHYMAVNWNFAPFTWMANFILPVGAILCGFVAAIGYWIGARLFNHRPTRMLILNIVLIALGTFFWIHQLDYASTKVQGVPLESFMTFPQYMVAVTEHMTYKDTHSGSSDHGTELGKWGWGVAALQVLGFSFGGLGVYTMLANVPYCDRCAKYLSERKHKTASWKDRDAMLAHFAALDTMLKQGSLQEAIDQHATIGENKRFGAKAWLQMELRKCPTCENRRLRLSATVRKGNQTAKAGQTDVKTEQPLQLAAR